MRKVILPLIVSAIMLAVLFVCPFYLIFHPTNIDDIYSTSDEQQYVNVHAETLYYTGYNLIKTFGREYGYYYALNEEKCVFAVIPINGTPAKEINNYTFKGKIIKKNTAFLRMMEAFSNDLNWNTRDLSDFSGDFIISGADYTPIKYGILLWITLFILLVSLKNVISSIIGIINPYLYPVFTFLEKKEQKQLIDSAQDELISDNYLQINAMYITENYFIDLGKYYVSIIPLKDIIWCYRVGELNFNPHSSSPDYSLCFTINEGSVITARHKTSDEALELLNAIRATEYDIIIGHSESKQREAKDRIKGQV
jgi:hypothetical protein